MTIQLIVGLGNPGQSYSADRHNAGQWFVELLCQQIKSSFSPNTKLNAQIAQGTFNQIALRLMIPMTYMNESGLAVKAVCQYYKIEPENVLVAHDELDLAPGIARLKKDGGHGGHNGLRSLIQHLGTNQFWRLRLGIGHPGHKDDVSDYVLTKPSIHETTQIEAAILESTRVLPLLLQGQSEKAQTQLHSQLK
jgi:PTH1 family peptidyl-tRNA hydrolase